MLLSLITVRRGFRHLIYELRHIVAAFVDITFDNMNNRMLQCGLFGLFFNTLPMLTITADFDLP